MALARSLCSWYSILLFAAFARLDRIIVALVRTTQPPRPDESLTPTKQSTAKPAGQDSTSTRSHQPWQWKVGLALWGNERVLQSFHRQGNEKKPSRARGPNQRAPLDLTWAYMRPDARLGENISESHHLDQEIKHAALWHSGFSLRMIGLLYAFTNNKST